MTRRKGRAFLAALALGGMPWITSATCDPVTGAFDLFRNDDYYDDYYYEDVYVDYYYDDCYFLDCF